ncbi:MAG: hypothetical protein HW421_3713 [Ignavibacteria bacterium]|nr:hypothetical protein [Ignavibacteria bacterium]
MKIIFFLIISTIVLPASFVVSNSQQPRQLGVNITENGAFVNIINHTNRYQKATGFDSLGWSLSDFELVLLDGRPATEWTNEIDDPEVYRIDYSGTYKSSFKGIADISLWGTAQITNKKYDTVSNLTTFDLVVPSPPLKDYGFIYLIFKNTKRSPESQLSSGITELKVMRPGYPLNTNKIFTDEYINLLKSADFACYRFYGVQNIWDGEPAYPNPTKWQNRKTPLDACQNPMTATTGKRDAWCWEYIIQLSNILKKDIWINIHISCDSDYVANLAQKLKTELDPSINIYVENSNEVWSPTQTTHGPYNKSQADFYKITFDENYARRTVELSNWFAEVFGKQEINKRIRVVLGAQASYGGRSDNHFNYINKTFGAPKNFIHSLAPALYFGSTNPNGDTTAINQGMLDDIDGQINNPSVSSYRKNHLNRAAKWELPGGCTSYEGGPGIPGGGNKTNLANQILANRTYKMKEILKKSYIEGWFSIEGGLALYFTLTSGYNRYGCWGITDDYTKPDRNFKMQAIREIINSTNDVDSQLSGISNESEPFATPNPSQSNATINFRNPSDGEVSIEIYNEYGQLFIQIPNKIYSAGMNSVNIDLADLPSGIYFYVIRNGIGLQSGKMVMVK